MVIAAFIVVAGLAIFLAAYVFLRTLKSVEKAEELFRTTPFHCGTPHVQNGGTLIAKTGDIIEIITREGTETMTVAEYETRKDERFTKQTQI